MAAAVTNGTRRCCPRPKPKATRRHSSKFSWLKHRASTLRSTTASARWPTPLNWCWGNGGSGENNARIVGEKVDKQNRGQYWNIKMLDLNVVSWKTLSTRKTSTTAATMRKSPGSCNGPAADGVWNNAQFVFEPVKGQKQTYIIRSAGKRPTKCMPCKTVNSRLRLTMQPTARRGLPSNRWKSPKSSRPTGKTKRALQNKEPGVATYMPYETEALMLAKQGLLRHPVGNAAQCPLPLPQRNVEVQPRQRTFEASARFLQRGLSTSNELGQHSRSLELGNAGLRQTHLQTT